MQHIDETFCKTFAPWVIKLHQSKSVFLLLWQLIGNKILIKMYYYLLLLGNSAVIKYMDMSSTELQPNWNVKPRRIYRLTLVD